MITVSTRTYTGERKTDWKRKDKLSLYGMIAATRQLSLYTMGVPRSVTIHADEAELDFLLEAVRQYENKLSGITDECIYCKSGLEADNRSGNTCTDCNTF